MTDLNAAEQYRLVEEAKQMRRERDEAWRLVSTYLYAEIAMEVHRGDGTYAKAFLNARDALISAHDAWVGAGGK